MDTLDTLHNYCPAPGLLGSGTCVKHFTPRTLHNAANTHNTHTARCPYISTLLTLGVVPLGPVVAGPGLPEHEVVGAEDTAVGAGPDDILLITRKEMFGDIDSIFLVCKDLR